MDGALEVVCRSVRFFRLRRGLQAAWELARCSSRRNLATISNMGTILPMTTLYVPISKGRTNLCELLGKVEAGARVVFTSHGRLTGQPRYLAGPGARLLDSPANDRPHCATIGTLAVESPGSGGPGHRSNRANRENRALAYRHGFEEPDGFPAPLLLKSDELTLETPVGSTDCRFHGLEAG